MSGTVYGREGAARAERLRSDLDGKNGLGAAALDVFEGQPRVPEDLLRSDRVLLTPHLGTATRETRARMGEMVLASLAEHFAGRDPAYRVV
jgi:lactate dehydrogenase-like 2-hydroxyacid dehydrogenase